MKIVVVVAVLAALLGLIPAYIAHRKRWPFVAWWIYGMLLFVIALPHAIFLNANPDKHQAKK